MRIKRGNGFADGAAIAARGGRIILITDPKGAERASVMTLATLILPEMAATVTPLVYVIPVQLIA